MASTVLYAALQCCTIYHQAMPNTKSHNTLTYAVLTYISLYVFLISSFFNTGAKTTWHENLGQCNIPITSIIGGTLEVFFSILAFTT